jgi:probable phosphomutase (TIGR03848 family)
MPSRTQAPSSRPRKAAAKPSGPTVVLFVRHGRTPTTGKLLPGRAGGLHLSPTGVAQAEKAAERIAALGRKPTAVYASPLERTKETAAPIAKALGLRVRTESGLVEVDIGEWTGQSLRRVARSKSWAGVQRWPSAFRFPGGESFGDMTLRVSESVLSLVEHHRGETIVAVSHADPIKAVVAWAAGVPLDLFQRFVVSPCSISAIAFASGGPMLLSVNSTATLDELVPS